MPGGIFAGALSAMMCGDLDLLNDKLTVALFDEGTRTPCLETDDTLASFPEGALVAELPLLGKALDETTFRAEDVLFKSVAEGRVRGVLIFNDTGYYENSLLVAWFPVDAFACNGEDVAIHWDTGRDGIFRL